MALTTRARERAVARGSLTDEELRSWIAVDDVPVAQAFSRSGTGVVEIERVLDVADTTMVEGVHLRYMPEVDQE